MVAPGREETILRVRTEAIHVFLFLSFFFFFRTVFLGSSPLRDRAEICKMEKMSLRDKTGGKLPPCLV